MTAIGRLKTRSEFVFVKGGTRFATPSLVLQARRRTRPTPSPEMARFGFTATKRLGGAVVRNRARRRLKEAVRLAAPSRARAGYDYVLIARGGAVQRPFTEVIKDLQRALIKVHEPSAGHRRRNSPSASADRTNRARQQPPGPNSTWTRITAISSWRSCCR
ncbi:ribonuclease P protein component [Methyloceanibacter methanicus]|uniref:ribonuclease P protein component n=1 Tax=Methyloceanibacter methanicus TaxID=1774968 RepID=UPI0009F6B67D